MTNHLGFDFDLVEFLAGIDTYDTPNHFWNDDHVSEMCLDEVGFLIGLGFLLGLAKLLNETHRLALQAAVKTTAGTSVNDVAQLF